MMIWRRASRDGGSCQPGLRSPKPCLLRLSLPVPANPGRGGSSSRLGAAPSVTGFAHAFRALAASTAAVDACVPADVFPKSRDSAACNRRFFMESDYGPLSEIADCWEWKSVVLGKMVHVGVEIRGGG